MTDIILQTHPYSDICVSIKESMMTYIKKIIIFLAIISFSASYSQFTLDAELRPRFEYRHGYKNPFPNNADPATFVSQRTRLNFGYKTEKFQLYVSTQDVRIWGDVPQQNVSDLNGFSLHQAWAEVLLTSPLFLKLGRQEIAYDDQRIMGNVDWAQQGRSHDAALLKYEPGSFKLHVGIAYNQDIEALTGNILRVNTYKSLQYAWLHKNWKDFSGSFLFLNNGLQYLDELEESNHETRYSQTTGLHLQARLSDFRISSNLYYQFGKDIFNNNIDAYLVSLEAKYLLTEKLNLGLGGEIQSGNDYGTPSNGKNRAFTPLYGTNHKFNGHMDYFYVGNHNNNVGLMDFYGNVNYSFNEKSHISLNFHKFFASAEIARDVSNDLGFELDLVTSHRLSDFVGIKAGYSQFFASKGIETVKNNFDGNTNNWAWAMITIDPVLFTWNNNKNQQITNIKIDPYEK